MPQVAFQRPPVKLIQFQSVPPGPAPRESLGLRSHSRWKSFVSVGVGRVTSAAPGDGKVPSAERMSVDAFILLLGLVLQRWRIITSKRRRPVASLSQD